MNRRVGACLLAIVVLSTIAVAVWRPWDRCSAPRQLCATARIVQKSAGVLDVQVSYQVTAADAKDGDLARADWSVRLDENLTPGQAGTIAGRATATIRRSTVPGADVEHSIDLTAGEPTGNPVSVSPLSVLAADDPEATVRQAFDLWRAGATRVTTGSAEVGTTEQLLALAQFAADHDYRTGLATTDGSARYETRGRVAPEDVRLLVDTAGSAGVEVAVLTADRSLTVHTTTADDSRQTAAVRSWLDGRRPPGDEPMPYTLTSPGYATVREGWVGDVRPPKPKSRPVQLPDGVEPWPKDRSAPDCAGDDLRLRLGSPDAAAGSRYLAVRAENVSDRPCALDGVPAVKFLNADAVPQAGITILPAAPGVVPERVVVPAGERALATLQWPAMSTSNDPDVTTAVEIEAVPGATPVRLAPEVDGTSTDLDVLDGAEVRIGPWAQAADGWSTG